jgi:hypothetical protein
MFGPMTVIAMSRTEIDRMSVLQDLAASRIKVTEAECSFRMPTVLTRLLRTLPNLAMPLQTGPPSQNRGA